MIEVQGLVKTYGPVYAFVDDSAPGAVVNGLMRRHAFQFADYILTSLPETIDALLEKIPVATSESPAADP